MKKIVVILLFGCFFSALKPVFGLWEKGKQVVTKEAEKIIPIEGFQEEYEAFKDDFDQFKGCISGALSCSTREALNFARRAMRKGFALTPQIMSGIWKKVAVDNQQTMNRVKVGIGDQKRVGHIPDVSAYLTYLGEENQKHPFDVKKALKGLEITIFDNIGRVRYNDRLKKAGILPV